MDIVQRVAKSVSETYVRCPAPMKAPPRNGTHLGVVPPHLRGVWVLDYTIDKAGRESQRQEGMAVSALFMCAMTEHFRKELTKYRKQNPKPPGTVMWFCVVGDWQVYMVDAHPTVVMYL